MEQQFGEGMYHNLVAGLFGTPYLTMFDTGRGKCQ
jgi:hypothetical protein